VRHIERLILELDNIGIVAEFKVRSIGGKIKYNIFIGYYCQTRGDHYLDLSVGKCVDMLRCALVDTKRRLSGGLTK